MRSKQSEIWAGDFGDAYTERNEVAPAKRVQAFKAMLEGLEIQSALEAGCNKGHNLEAIALALGRPCELSGIELNKHALELARKTRPQFNFIEGELCALPFESGSFDLAFTAGVLIHIPPASLEQAMAEIFRVAKRYVLCVEYRADSEEEIAYRGQAGLLWKRDYGAIYRKSFPELEPMRSGFWTAEDGFDRTHWNLFKKA